MSRGLSARQRQALALLVTHKRPLDVTSELLPLLGVSASDSTRRSLLRALRLLERRGLVSLERVPSERGGWPRLIAAARPGARGELFAADLQRASASVPSPSGELNDPEADPPWTVRAANERARSALPTEGGDGNHWFIKSHRMPYTATHHAGLIKTTVTPMITDAALVDHVAAVLRKLPGSLEVVAFPGDHSRNLRPLAYVYWDARRRLKGTQKPGGNAGRGKNPARYFVKRGPRASWHVIDQAKSKTSGWRSS